MYTAKAISHESILVSNIHDLYKISMCKLTYRVVYS